MIDRLGESVPRYFRILRSQILPPELLQKIIENYYRDVGFEPMPSRMVFRRVIRYTTTTLGLPVIRKISDLEFYKKYGPYFLVCF